MIQATRTFKPMSFYKRRKFKARKKVLLQLLLTALAAIPFTIVMVGFITP